VGAGRRATVRRRADVPDGDRARAASGDARARDDERRRPRFLGKGRKENRCAIDIARGENAWKNEFEIDMMHTVRTVEAALPWIEKSDAGSIVVISSVSGLEFDFTSPAYGTFKAALVHYASRMASTLAGKHIRVNTVSPGNTYFEGGIWQKIEKNMPDLFKTALAKNPWGRMATDLEVANAAVFLASPRASFITGVNLVVDGALTNRVQY
jgi:3-oxoacyl-[acyl-carrier protein] reductase